MLKVPGWLSGNVPEPSPYLNVRQVATLLGMHPESVRKMVREGRLPAFKAGRSWRFDRAEIETWLRARGGPTYAAPPHPVAQRPRADGCAVLVIDDDEQVATTISQMVARTGCRVRQALSGAEGLIQVSRERPDLILLDLMMPGMNGVRFLEDLRAEHATIPVALVTGHPDSNLVAEAMRHAPILLLAKPLEPIALDRTMRALLGSRYAPVAVSV